MNEIDVAFWHVRRGDHEAFASWLRLCEAPLRASLRSFAVAVDVEAVLQEALLRMWQLAPRLALHGEEASLHYARRLARNLALSEARRLRRASDADIKALAAPAPDPDDDPTPADPALERAIRRCFEQLPESPRAALLARLEGGSDRAIAARLGVRVNALLQRVVRGRRLLEACLQRAGVDLEEYVG